MRMQLRINQQNALWWSKKTRKKLFRTDDKLLWIDIAEYEQFLAAKSLILLAR